MRNKFTVQDVKDTFKPRTSIFVALYVNYISIPFVLFFSNWTNFTPNMITSLSFAVGLCSAVSFYAQDYLLGAMLFHLSFILDCVDGKLARLKGTQSKTGDMYDHISGQLLNLIIALILVINFYDNTSISIPLIIFLFFAPFNYFVNYYGKYTFPKESSESVFNKNNSKRTQNFILRIHYYLRSKGIKTNLSDVEATHCVFFLTPIFLYCDMVCIAEYMIWVAILIYIIDELLMILKNIFINKI